MPANTETEAGSPVLMIRRDLDGVPEFPLPAGYELTSISKSTVSDWTEVQGNAEPFNPTSIPVFHDVFGSDYGIIGQRCFLLRDPGATAVGSISAWFDDDFRGECWGRIHWLAIIPQEQKRGLAKGLLSRCLDRLGRWHDKAYLKTNANRLPAIQLYLNFGFVPAIDSKSDRQTWQEIHRRLGEG